MACCSITAQSKSTMFQPFPYNLLIYLFSFAELGVELRTLHTLGKHSPIELRPLPLLSMAPLLPIVCHEPNAKLYSSHHLLLSSLCWMAFLLSIDNTLLHFYDSFSWSALHTDTCMLTHPLFIWVLSHVTSLEMSSLTMPSKTANSELLAPISAVL